MDAAPQAHADDGWLSTNSDPSSRRRVLLRHPAHSSSHRRTGNVGSAYPKNQEGLAKALRLVDGERLLHECRVSHDRQHAGTPPGTDRRTTSALPGRPRPEALRPKRALYLQRFNAHIAWLAEVLADGRKFILGSDPSAADLSAYHPIWFARQNGGSEVNELIAFANVIDPWYKRVAAIGHGNFSEMTPEQAIEVAGQRTKRSRRMVARAQNVGLRRGDWVSVTPDDYGNPVHGSHSLRGRPTKLSSAMKIPR